MEGKKFLTRTLCIAVALVLVCVYFFYLLYDAQVVNAITDSVSTDLSLTSSTETVEAARGNVYDRYGRLLVGNTTVYNVELDIDNMGSEANQAATVVKLIDLCEEQGLEWNNSEFPVEYDADSGSFAFTTDTPYVVVSNGAYTATRLNTLCQNMGWGTTGTSANTLIRQMCNTFSIDGSLDPERKLEILGVLYSALLRSGVDQIIWTDYYFLEDVDFSFISVVKEEGLDGVNIVATTERSYNTDYAGVLLGQVGAISAESWSENKETYLAEGYSMDSIIGLSGVESAFEEYLRGTDGTKTVTKDSDGNIVSEEYTEEPQAGNNVTLTIDIKLQEAAEEALEKYTESINDGAGGSAAVVVDIDTGEILASASWPTFSAATYTEDYEELASDELLPLYNRALLGTYAPGSTYKICSAVAGLSSGAITTSTTFECNYRFQYYDWVYRCWYSKGHGTEDVADAVRDSCNVFFYNLADIVGIDTLTDYALQFGLGVSTGVELSESTGVNAGPDYSESVGATWTLGNVMSAVIGQSDNQFTPLQLANYIATFINGGTRYSAHFLKSVKSYDNSEIVTSVEPTALNEVDISSDAYAAIKKGMGEVIDADNITDFDTLRSWGIDVGLKTGTAQLGTTGLYNAVIVAFAPYDDPEIAICTVVEKSPSQGADTAMIAAAILEYYFSDDATLERVNAENALIN